MKPERTTGLRSAPSCERVNDSEAGWDRRGPATENLIRFPLSNSWLERKLRWTTPKRWKSLNCAPVIKQVVYGHPVADKVIQLAYGTFQTMYREAIGYGLTEADVIRAVLYPSFERKRGCDCPTCKARRTQAEEGQLEQWRIGLPQQVVS